MKADSEFIIEVEAANHELETKGLYYRLLFSFSPLSKEKQKELVKKASDGDKAAEELLVLSNMKLVAKIAEKYKGCGIPLEDMYQQGALGLLLAIRRYNMESGASLATYATYWIKKMILLHINKCGRLIKLPENKVKLWLEIKKEAADYYLYNYRMPSAEELSQSMGVSTEKIKEMLGYIEMEPISIDEWNNIIATECVEDDYYAQLIEETALLSKREELLYDAIDQLDEKHKMVILCRYGLGNERRQSLQEIAKRLGVSKQRVSKIQQESEKTLRALLSELT